MWTLLITQAALAAEPAPVQAYGFVRIVGSASNGSLSSFGRSNAVAPTSAGNPSLVSNPTAPRLSWQAGQTRLGLKLGSGPATAKVEVDFADFAQAAGTTSLKPRLRIAQVQWQASPGTRFILGQGWDLFSPLNPFQFNAVGAGFQGGNAGFMRPQAIVAHAIGDAELAWSVGATGSTSTELDGLRQESLAPTGALRLTLKAGELGSVGVSAFGADLPVAEGSAQAWGANSFADLKFKSGTKVRWEAYYGQNLGNAGMLTLGVGSETVDIRELGSWVSVKQPIAGIWSTTVTLHGAAVLNPEDLAPGYTPGDAQEPLGTRTGLGITHNVGERASVQAQVAPGLEIFVEGYAYQTAFVRAKGDPTAWDEDQSRLGADLGAIYRF